MLIRGNISTAQLAKICGVSQGTVDRALNNRKGINPQTRERILSVAREYGYRPNIHARCMAGGRSMLIGVVVFDLNNQYFSDFLTELSNYCASVHYSTVVMFTDKDPARELECIQSLYHMSVDGIILCPVNGGEAFENYLLSLNIPIVTIGNRLHCLPHVGIDDRQAMADTTAHVLRLGYDHLLYVRPRLSQRNISAQALRLEGFTATVTASGTPHAVTAIDNAEAALIPGKRNAFVCPTDVYALRLLAAAQNHSAGIIGFDNIRLIDILHLKLDSVSYNIPQAVRLAAEYIIEGHPISVSVSHKLVFRGSL